MLSSSFDVNRAGPQVAAGCLTGQVLRGTRIHRKRRTSRRVYTQTRRWLSRSGMHRDVLSFQFITYSPRFLRFYYGDVFCCTSPLILVVSLLCMGAQSLPDSMSLSKAEKSCLMQFRLAIFPVFLSVGDRFLGNHFLAFKLCSAVG